MLFARVLTMILNDPNTKIWLEEGWYHAYISSEIIKVIEVVAASLFIGVYTMKVCNAWHKSVWLVTFSGFLHVFAIDAIAWCFGCMVRVILFRDTPTDIHNDYISIYILSVLGSVCFIFVCAKIILHQQYGISINIFDSQKNFSAMKYIFALDVETTGQMSSKTR